MSWRGALAALALFVALPAAAGQSGETIVVCFNYGCLGQAEVVYDDARLREIGALLGEARDAAQEREKLALAVGRLLAWAGEQSPIFADRGGNYADEGVYGKMDCIDHSTTTTRLLRMLERRGLIRYHRVLEPVLRQRFLFFEHYSAAIEEVDAAGAGDEVSDGRRYVVDSWFFDNGQPAAVMPLALWQSGAYPDGAE